MVGPMINSFVFMNIKDLKTYVLYKLRISTVLLAENCWVILHPSRPFCINQGKTRLDEDQGSNMEKLDLFLIVQLLKALGCDDCLLADFGFWRLALSPPCLMSFRSFSCGHFYSIQLGSKN
ncbi:uncharacterized protein LOC107426974 isoform X1 [Ziziphus jujuba]|uniref:Uncharacterized protein LOC107426974 isoform X1 n=1 Tax=Ziziphus jujuba TaxID=326968 RepID=A0ABM3HZY4_ZIZJJ|nr:uncharacterized protein LOC107426974 isoform X1 [Ziziphus jujuba]